RRRSLGVGSTWLAALDTPALMPGRTSWRAQPRGSPRPRDLAHDDVLPAVNGGVSVGLPPPMECGRMANHGDCGRKLPGPAVLVRGHVAAVRRPGLACRPTQ